MSLLNWLVHAASTMAAMCDSPQARILVTITSLLVLSLGTTAGVMWQTLAAAVGLQRELSLLPAVNPPQRLRSAAAAAGISRLVHLDMERPAAFCAGLLRPTVYVSGGLLSALAEDELRAVLLHEAYHARRHDPLRRSLRSALQRTLFYVPLLRWWADRQSERAELAADRAALGRFGPAVVARALFAVQPAQVHLAMSAFSGYSPSRVAQLLGEPIEQGRPSVVALGLSLLGLATALVVARCFASGLLYFPGFFGG